MLCILLYVFSIVSFCFGVSFIPGVDFRLTSLCSFEVWNNVINSKPPLCGLKVDCEYTHFAKYLVISGIAGTLKLSEGEVYSLYSNSSDQHSFLRYFLKKSFHRNVITKKRQGIYDPNSH